MQIIVERVARRAGPLTLPLLLCLPVGPAIGQETQAGVRGLEEITVTARRKEESLLSVPMSISALGAADLDEANIKTFVDLAQFAPGLSFNESSAGRHDRYTPNYVIRGLFQSGGVGGPGAFVFLDGAAVTSGRIYGFTDIERVEVLKGPQAAYFGRNTFAGAINVVTKTPDLDEWGGTASMEFAQYNSLDGSLSVDGPLIPDKLSVRISGRAQSSDGQYPNRGDGGKALGSQKTESLSLTLYGKPTEQFTAKLFATLDRVDDGPGAHAKFQNWPGEPDQLTCDPRNTGVNTYICGVVPAFPEEWLGVDDAVTPRMINGLSPLSQFGKLLGGHGGVTVRQHSANLQLQYGFANGMSLESLTAYTYSEAQNVSDQDYRASLDLPNPNYPANPNAPQYFNFLFAVDATDEVFSQELRLTSAQNQRLRWTGGLSYVEYSGLNGQAADGPVGFQLYPNSGDKSTITTGGFGGLYFDVTDKWTFSAEGRYQEDEVGVTRLNAQFVPTGQPELSRSFTSFTPRISVDYKPNSDIMYYAFWARGFRPGGLNIALFAQPDYIVDQIEANVGGNREVDPEKLDSFDIGIKGRLWNGRVQYSLGAYYGTLTDQQISQGTTVFNDQGAPVRFTVVRNGGETELRGIELEATAAVTDKLTLKATFSDNYAEIKEGFCTLCQTISGNGDTAGKRVPQAPRYKASLSAMYRTPVGDNYEWYAGGSYSYSGNQYDNETNLLGTGEAHLVNVRTGIETGDWRIEGFVTNLFDDDTALSVSSALNLYTFQQTAVTVSLPDKRQWGVRVRYDF